MIIRQAARFNFGFASNMALLLWCVCGGFLLHFLESNYLGILVKVNYEKPVDTAQDVVDRGLEVIFVPAGGGLVEESKNSPFALIRSMAELTVVPKVIFS